MHKRTDTRKKTPWGVAQTTEEVARGITRYSTASHGGYHLDQDMNAKVAPALKNSTFGELGMKGWYEEDVDWAIVVYTFPEHFDSERYEAAVQCLKQHHQDAWNQTQKQQNKS